MILFFDVETTGLPNFSRPLDHPSQPYIVQLAALLCADETCEIQEQYVSLIKPDGWTIEDGAARVHGITAAHASALGEDADIVMRRFYNLVSDATPGRVCGHNVTFDIRMALRHAYSLGLDPHGINELEPFCTMRALTRHCRIPHPRHLHEFKWPSLREAYAFMFNGASLEGAHTALIDALACREIFIEGRKRAWWK